MALIFKPHTVTLAAPAQAAALDKSVPAATWSGSTSLSCKVEPISAETAFRLFNVEQDNAFRLMADLSAAASLATNTRVSWAATGQVFRVRAVRAFRSGMATEHVSALLDLEEA